MNPLLVEHTDAVQALRDESNALELTVGYPVAPLSFAQEQVWFLQRCDETNPFYNLSEAHYISGPLDVDKVERAFGEVILRHIAFRTRFLEIEGRAWQIEGPPVAPNLEFDDISALPLGDRQRYLDAALAEFSRAPFDLEQGPLHRAKLVCLDEANHVFIFVAHHLIVDGWSLGVIYDELGKLYAQDDERELNELPVPKSDPHTQAWLQRERWLRGEIDEDIAKAAERLSGFVRTELPTTRARPAVFSYKGARAVRLIDRQLSNELVELARKERTTPFMLFVSLFAIVLHRYSGETDIVFGIPTSGRSTRDLHGVVGFFANTVALRVDLSGSPDLKTVVRRGRKATLEATVTSDTPFEKVVDALNLDRDPGRSAIFQNMLVMPNGPATELRLGGLSVRPMNVETGGAQFELTLDIRNTQDGFVLMADYATDLFDEWLVDRLLQRFVQLARGAVKDSSSHISEMTMISDDDLVALASLNDTNRSYPRTGNIPRLIEERAATSPDSVAVCDTSAGSLTYGEIEARASQLAHWLQRRGAGPGQIVALSLNRTVGIVPAILGAWKTGSAFVFVDPCAPEAHRAHLLETTEPCAVVDEQVMCDPAVASHDRDYVGPTISDDMAAYIFHTSGSSGTPKGVIGHHGGLTNRLLWMIEAYSMSKDDVSMVLAPLSFDVSLWEMLAVLIVGGRSVIFSDEVIRDPRAIVQGIIKHNVSIAEFVPVTLQYCLEEPAMRLCASLKRALCGSETMPPELQRRFYSCLPNAHLYNVFGPTEATIDSLFWRCEASADVTRAVPIGRPIANTSVHILDDHGNYAGIGRPGELYIGGIGVALGYHKLPSETAEKFVFGTAAGGKLYRTGDRVMLRPDGALEFLGRLDRQVKLKGMRIEPGEIEAVLSSHPAVRSSGVLVVEDGARGRQLVAAVETMEPVTPQAIREYLRSTLPRYMVPTRVIVLERLPRNRNGKVDIGALRRLAQSWEEPRDRVQAPQAVGTHAALASIWQEVLGCGDIAAEDNFFDIGGDSILILQVVARARRVGLPLSPKMCYQHQTLAELGSAIAGTDGQGLLQASKSSAISPANSIRSIPLTPIQSWFFGSKFKEPDYYNDAVYLQVRPGVELNRLIESFKTVFSFHDAFRLRFEENDGVWSQRYADDVPMAVEGVDLRAVSAAEREAVRARYLDEAHRKMRLSEGPTAACVYFLEPDGLLPHVFVVAHHLAIDAVSWRIILEDVQDVYHNLVEDGEPRLVRTASFGQWAEVVTTAADRLSLRDELDFWSVQTGTHLPVDSSGCANLVGRTRAVRRILDRNTTRRLLTETMRTLSVRFGDILIAAALESVLSWSGGTELGVELEGHGREDLEVAIDTSRTVGWFTSLYPVRLHLDAPERRSPAQKVAAVREQLACVPRRGLSYGVLRYCAGEPCAQSLNAMAPPQFHFNYAGQFDNLFGRQALFSMLPDEPGLLQSASESRGPLIEVNAFVLNGCLYSDWTYCVDIHKAETIKGLGNRFLSELEDIARRT